MVARLVEHEEVVRDHDEYCQRHPGLFSPRKNADSSQRLGTLQPQRPLHNKTKSQGVQHTTMTKSATDLTLLSAKERFFRFFSHFFFCGFRCFFMNNSGRFNTLIAWLLRCPMSASSDTIHLQCPRPRKSLVSPAAAVAYRHMNIEPGEHWKKQERRHSSSIYRTTSTTHATHRPRVLAGLFTVDGLCVIAWKSNHRATRNIFMRSEATHEDSARLFVGYAAIVLSHSIQDQVQSYCILREILGQVL